MASCMAMNGGAGANSRSLTTTRNRSENGLQRSCRPIVKDWWKTSGGVCLRILEVVRLWHNLENCSQAMMIWTETRVRIETLGICREKRTLRRTTGAMFLGSKMCTGLACPAMRSWQTPRQEYRHENRRRDDDVWFDRAERTLIWLASPTISAADSNSLTVCQLGASSLSLTPIDPLLLISFLNSTQPPIPGRQTILTLHLPPLTPNSMMRPK